MRVKKARRQPMSATTNHDLLSMLRWKRPAGSEHEDKFVQRFIDTVPGMEPDNYGNRWLLHATSRTLISVHTDTVHRNSGMQTVTANALGVVSLAESCKPEPRIPLIDGNKGGKKTKSGNQLLKWAAEQSRWSRYMDEPFASHCLGADDTAGVYAALRMIEAKVPVSFVFHRDEEIGGKGSAWVAENYGEWLEAAFDRCIALDRRGTKDVIISQRGGECCSIEFAVTLGKALGMGHKPAAGVFTDSANYMGLIPECSNISIGYMHEHTTGEKLDTLYLEALIERLCAVDWDTLPVERDPYAVDTGMGMGMSFMWPAGQLRESKYTGRSDGWGREEEEEEDYRISQMLADMGIGEEELSGEEWERMMEEEEEWGKGMGGDWKRK